MPRRTGPHLTANNAQPATPQAKPPHRATHPLWARPGLLAIACILAVAYGSLVPFDFAWSDAVARHGGIWRAVHATLQSPRWTPAVDGHSTLGVPYAFSDLFMNTLLYLPVGVTLRMAIRLHARRWVVELLGTVAAVFALSWLVESAQGLSPTRVASLADICTNTSAAAAAALLAPHAWGLYKRLSFAAYCRLAPLRARLSRWRGRPVTAMLIALINAILIGVWYAAETSAVWRGDTPPSAAPLPFERVFYLPYDLGAVVLGRSLLAYAGLGCLLLLLTHTGRRRFAMGGAVLGVTLLALAAELSRSATSDAAPDLTGTLLALAAGVLMTVTVYSFSLAVRRSNRRRRDAEYDGPDRRRRPHEYA